MAVTTVQYFFDSVELDFNYFGIFGRFGLIFREGFLFSVDPVLVESFESFLVQMVGANGCQCSETSWGFNIRPNRSSSVEGISTIVKA